MAQILAQAQDAALTGVNFAQTTITHGAQGVINGCDRFISEQDGRTHISYSDLAILCCIPVIAGYFGVNWARKFNTLSFRALGKDQNLPYRLNKFGKYVPFAVPFVMCVFLSVLAFGSLEGASYLSNGLELNYIENNQFTNGKSWQFQQWIDEKNWNLRMLGTFCCLILGSVSAVLAINTVFFFVLLSCARATGFMRPVDIHEIPDKYNPQVLTDKIQGMAKGLKQRVSFGGKGNKNHPRSHSKSGKGPASPRGSAHAGGRNTSGRVSKKHN